MDKVYDWDNAVPSPETWAALQVATDESFPRTYGGSAWHAAFRLMKVAKEQPERFASWDGWTADPLAYEVTHGLDLTGFLFGYALNAVRHMLEMPPVADGATVAVGSVDKNATVRSLPSSPKGELRKALGGKEDDD